MKFTFFIALLNLSSVAQTLPSISATGKSGYSMIGGVPQSPQWEVLIQQDFKNDGLTNNEKIKILEREIKCLKLLDLYQIPSGQTVTVASPSSTLKELVGEIAPQLKLKFTDVEPM